MQPTNPTAAEPTLPPPPPEKPPQTFLDLITSVLSILLVSSLTVRSFIGRWQVLHAKLTSLQSSVSLLSDSPHWSQNPLLHTLLPSILSTLQRLHSLCNQSSLSSFNGGKLLFQSDLDIASSSLSNHLHDLDLLLKSGVLHQSNAIVLSNPGPSSTEEELGFYIRDLFTRLQIGGVEFKKKALDSLLQILNEKSASLVAKEGNVAYLISLLDFNNNNHRLIQEQAVLAVSILASASDEARKTVFEQGGLGPLIRILDSGSMSLKEKAAIAVEAITSDPDNGWAILAYGGVSVLIEVCRSGSEAARTHAVGAIRNVAAVDDIKMAIAEEGGVSVIVNLLVSNSSTNAAREKAADCAAVMASSGEYFRTLIIKERGLHRLMDLIQSLPNSDTLEHVLRVISSLSISESVSKTLSASTLFIIRLGDFIRQGNLILQQISVTLLASLTISDGNKRAIEGCVASLLKLIEMPKPAGLQESATVALVNLLTVKSNKKELVRDEKCLMKLIQMLDPKNEFVAKKFPVMVVAALISGGSGECRKSLLAAGAHQHLQSLAEMEVAGAKKALQRLAGNTLKNILSRTWRELH
ncbi:protein CELLULOSE SYNTHASE INTERACTIVE 1 [Mercurialis annua]|uniref:protein CELLULOSE SYNTHASE INTERACTIVE 1 n=1 Tax=Mercurialis annua TaxID=3986 RepID=UPI00215F60F3|nr:protein CELLULOSE SYNTHASE INTERACTIVE 1 [Mercurialis annua]